MSSVSSHLEVCAYEFFELRDALSLGLEAALTATRPNYHLTALCLFADASTLDLVTEKTNAHSDGVRSVAFSHDGSKVVSGSDDMTIKVWKLVTKKPSFLCTGTVKGAH